MQHRNFLITHFLNFVQYFKYYKIFVLIVLKAKFIKINIRLYFYRF